MGSISDDARHTSSPDAGRDRPDETGRASPGHAPDLPRSGNHEVTSGLSDTPTTSAPDPDETDRSLDSLIGDAEPGDMIGRSPGTRQEPGPTSPERGADSYHSGPEALTSQGEVSGTAASDTGTPGTEGAASSESTWLALDDLDEATIVSRAQDGDLEAFEWLVTAYQGGIFRLAFRMLGDHAEAEDVVQETFIAAWRNLPSLTAAQAFIPWLYRSATNKCFDLLRGRQRRPVDPTPFDDGSEGSSASPDRGEGDPGERRQIAVGSRATQDPALQYETEAQMQALADLLQTVPDGSRACWLLRDVHEFSYAEIAVIVELSESTVRGRIARARRLLAEGMESWR